MRIITFATAAALLLGSAASSTAQRLELDPSVRLATAYEARGLTYHDGLAGQLTLDLALAGTAGELRAGAWTNVELLRQDGAPTMLAEAAPGMSEVNLYLSAARSVEWLDLSAGWIYFLWPTGFDFSDASPVHELFLGASVPIPGLAGGSLGATTYYDFTARGAYGEVTAATALPAIAGATPDLAATLAWILDQEEYYDRADGLTHFSLTLGIEQPGRWTLLRPEVRWTLALDPAARTGALRDGGRQKLHLGLVITPR